MDYIFAGLVLFSCAILILAGGAWAIIGAMIFAIADGHRSPVAAAATGVALFFGGLAVFTTAAGVAIEIVG